MQDAANTSLHTPMAAHFTHFPASPPHGIVKAEKSINFQLGGGTTQERSGHVANHLFYYLKIVRGGKRERYDTVEMERRHEQRLRSA
ncbi:hypothetical protein POVWA2_017220 [Plasmodium ovale wallikeri]|uniref:Uncharacterized protein n=1 Tax=Plasmodium ovale wallikeri TaxID=864142 RepID=A0A1A8YQK9_PLAOA|nr:hypothetical protein POVWA1_017330 [Plasmodium ovale wallikeri]SBT33912.1 hypothetical protein POVWA2_017220 [Plasmodium ovale wallikeri]